jgi:hypothetical protein
MSLLQSHAFRVLSSINLRSQISFIQTTRAYSSQSDDSQEAEFAKAREWYSNFKKSTIPEKIATTKYSKASGSGGQKTNKYDTSHLSQGCANRDSELTRKPLLSGLYTRFSLWYQKCFIQEFETADFTLPTRMQSLSNATLSAVEPRIKMKPTKSSLLRSRKSTRILCQVSRQQRQRRRLSHCKFLSSYSCKLYLLHPIEFFTFHTERVPKGGYHDHCVREKLEAESFKDWKLKSTRKNRVEMILQTQAVCKESKMQNYKMR